MILHSILWLKNETCQDLIFLQKMRKLKTGSEVESEYRKNFYICRFCVTIEAAVRTVGQMW